MAIRLYSGIMGSGKTYRVVYELKNTDLLDKYFIFHNLEELKIESKYLKEYGKNSGFNPPDLFTYEYQTKLTKQIKEDYGRNILWIIEECDKIGFDKSSPKIKEWLSMHRHLGQDIYLISQSKWNIAKEYVNLVEVEIQGKRGFVFDQFIYSWFSGGEKVATDRLPKQKAVYQLYKSFHIPELKKKRSNLWKWALVFFILALCGTVYFFFFGLPGKFTSMGENVKKANHIKNDDINIIKNNNNKNQNQISDLSPVKFQYSYAGTIQDQLYISDQFGNIYPIQNIYKKVNFIKDEKRRAIILLNDQKTIYEATYTKRIAVAGSGRESRPGQAQEQEQANIKRRELWINIY